MTAVQTLCLLPLSSRSVGVDNNRTKRTELETDQWSKNRNLKMEATPEGAVASFFRFLLKLKEVGREEECVQIRFLTS